MNVVELKNVEKVYRMDDVYVPILKGISLKIRKGEFVSIMGPSGSGKSTLLHLIGALDRPTKGAVLIEGNNISDMSDNELANIRGRKIGFVFQTFNLIPRLTALENVMLPMWFTGKLDRDIRAKYLLEKVGLGQRTHHLPNQLSGGERQRVAVARALANTPEIIVADEPTGNLDSKTGTEIMNMLREINDEGNTLVLVTHDMKLADTAERVVQIMDGKMIKGG